MKFCNCRRILDIFSQDLLIFIAPLLSKKYQSLVFYDNRDLNIAKLEKSEKYFRKKFESFIRLFYEHFTRHFESHWRETRRHNGTRTEPPISLETPSLPWLQHTSSHFYTYIYFIFLLLLQLTISSILKMYIVPRHMKRQAKSFYFFTNAFSLWLSQYMIIYLSFHDCQDHLDNLLIRITRKTTDIIIIGNL